METLQNGMSVGDLVTILREAHENPERHAALGNITANGRRLVPPKVMFAGVRTR